MADVQKMKQILRERNSTAGTNRSSVKSAESPWPGLQVQKGQIGGGAYKEVRQRLQGKFPGANVHKISRAAIRRRMEKRRTASVGGTGQRYGNAWGQR